MQLKGFRALKYGPSMAYLFVILFLFAFMMSLQLLFVIFIMPETKGVSIELLFKEVLESKNKKRKKENNS